MYVSIRKYKVTPGATPEMVKRVNEEFAPMISKTPGFIAYYGVDTGNDVVASISVFLTQSAAEESNRLAGDWVVGNIAPLIENAADVTTGKVVVHKKSY